MNDLILQAPVADLTRGRFLRSPAFCTWLEKQGLTSIDQVHPSLGNADAISMIIKKQQLLANPLGSDVAGT